MWSHDQKVKFVSDTTAVWSLLFYNISRNLMSEGSQCALQRTTFVMISQYTAQTGSNQVSHQVS